MQLEDVREVEGWLVAWRETATGGTLGAYPTGLLETQVGWLAEYRPHCGALSGLGSSDET